MEQKEKALHAGYEDMQQLMKVCRMNCDILSGVDQKTDLNRYKRRNLIRRIRKLQIQLNSRISSRVNLQKSQEFSRILNKPIEQMHDK